MDNPKPIAEKTPIRAVRCAIYTRKSTQEGLEQEFNSLQAQREAAEAYIVSQRHLGWAPIQTRYDDGGFSGGSIDRPALRQLLDDIEAQKIDCVVVYKVDRLSRSLLDFARLMDRFEQRSVSFVSVTQQFSTTSSLGRLTLNILLSFAQFEREIISERTRDKMSAARRKGKWIGGTPPLGYDVDPRGGRIAVNAAEAKRVREIFELYQRHRSLVRVVDELSRRCWTTKSWTSRRGVRHKGRPFTKASLRLLLTNPTYCGRILHRGGMYIGEHEAIVKTALWEDVNREFSERRRPQRSERNEPQNAPLAGILVCKRCAQPMIATYSMKNGQRYRYYVCEVARQKGWTACPTKSVSANALEASILNQLQTKFRSGDALGSPQIPYPELEAFFRSGLDAAPEVIRSLVDQVQYDGPGGTVWLKLRSDSSQAETLEYKVPGRRGRALPAFRHQPAIETVTRPPRLARLVALAHKLETLVRSGKVKGFVELARFAHISPTRIGQIILLGQLAPPIQEHVLFMPVEHAALIAERELREIAQDPIWDRQRGRFEQLLEDRLSATANRHPFADPDP